MTIKAKLQIAITVALGLALVVGSVTFFATQQVEKATKENRIANELVKGVFELNIVTHDYRSYRNTRSYSQWWNRYKSNERLLEGIERFENRKKQELVESLRESHVTIAETFSKLVEEVQRERAETGDDTASRELEDRLEGQLAIKSQAMVSSAFALAEQTSREFIARQRQLNLFFIVSIFLLIAIIVIASLIIMRIILRRIVAVRNVAVEIASGNMTVEIDTSGKDEIGELNRAIDIMRESLKVAGYKKK